MMQITQPDAAAAASASLIFNCDGVQLLQMSTASCWRDWHMTLQLPWQPSAGTATFQLGS